jgi:hypothetical protein
VCIHLCIHLCLLAHNFCELLQKLPKMETLSKPVYLKNSEIQKNRNNRISDFELMEIVIQSVGDTVRCVIFGEFT